MAELKHWELIRARGKKHFIARDMLWSLVFWSIVLLALELFGRHRSLGKNVLVGVIMLPILALGAYLRARWSWQDFEKKYRDDI